MAGMASVDPLYFNGATFAIHRFVYFFATTGTIISNALDSQETLHLLKLDFFEQFMACFRFHTEYT